MSERRYVHDSVLHNRRAADRVVPCLIDRYAPRTVLDVGCGLGTWSAVFLEKGCDVLGLDGEQISDDLLQIPREHFRVIDFERGIELTDHFDLALCLEVAEHLTAPAGQQLVNFLTGASDVILFSAAIPEQGGQNHLTERWPRYWQQLFAARGYACQDDIRWAYWDDESVDWWYRQNMFVASRGDGPSTPLRAVVHPGLFEWALAEKAQHIAELSCRVDDFYHGRVPLRAGAVVFARALANALRCRRFLQ